MNPKSSQPFVNFFLGIIIFLLAVFYILFWPEKFESENHLNQLVPIQGTEGVKLPSEIQGNSQITPQNSAKLSPGDLKSLSF